MARLSSERAVVQSPLVRYATEAGWTYIDPEDALRLRRGEGSPILLDIFIQRVQAANVRAGFGTRYLVIDATRRCRNLGLYTAVPATLRRHGSKLFASRATKAYNHPARHLLQRHLDAYSKVL
jgi:hypothetical protein